MYSMQSQYWTFGKTIYSSITAFNETTKSLSQSHLKAIFDVVTCMTLNLIIYKTAILKSST